MLYHLRWAALAASTLCDHSPAQSAAATLDQKTRATTTRRVATLLQRHYVFRDTAKRCGSFVRKQRAAGAYAQLGSPVAFADELTSDLRSVCKDLHVRVKPKSAKGRARSKHSWRPRGDLAIDRHGFARVQVLRENIGYLRLRWFDRIERARPKAEASMKKLENVDALVIDVRDNTGGSSTMVRFLCSYFFAKPTNLLDTYWRSRNRTEPCKTSKPATEGLVDVPLLVVVDRHSLSAAEMLAYCLQGHRRALVVGERTAGAANSTSDFSVNRWFVVSIPTGASKHPKTGKDWERTGVIPDLTTPRSRVLQTAFRKARELAKTRR